MPWIWKLEPTFSSWDAVRNHLPPIYKNIVHEKFPNGIKKSGLKKELRHGKQDSQRDAPAVGDELSRSGKKDFFKGICKPVEKGCVGRI